MKAQTLGTILCMGPRNNGSLALSLCGYYFFFKEKKKLYLNQARSRLAELAAASLSLQMSVWAATWQELALRVSGAQQRTQNFLFQRRFQNSSSLSSSLQGPIVCHIYLPSLLFVSKRKEKCQDWIPACPQNSAKALQELRDRWSLNDIQNLCPWARFGGAVLDCCS